MPLQQAESDRTHPPATACSDLGVVLAGDASADAASTSCPCTAARCFPLSGLLLLLLLLSVVKASPSPDASASDDATVSWSLVIVRMLQSELSRVLCCPEREEAAQRVYIKHSTASYR